MEEPERNESGASPIRVTPKDGKIRLGSGGKYVTYSDGRFIAGDNAPEQPHQWLHLAELSGLGETDYVTYSSDKISISDAPDGSSVIVYTRVWNDDYKAYEFFAVDHDGTLYPCYERGDNMMKTPDGSEPTNLPPWRSRTSGAGS